MGKEQNKNQEETDCSVVFQVLLPIFSLALLWGQRSIFSRALLQLDKNCLSVYCPSLSKREKLLKWAIGRLPLTWSSRTTTLSSGIPELWKNGFLLCSLINSAIPGACQNPHRHWKKPPLHAQAIAYKYLGLIPMFNEDELNNDLNINLETKFINYLYKLQQAIKRWNNIKESNHNDSHSSKYIARGMGLYIGEQYRKTVFYLYTKMMANNDTKYDNVLLYIRGPYGTQAFSKISPFNNPDMDSLKKQFEANKVLLLKKKEPKSFLKTISFKITSLIKDVQEKTCDEIRTRVYIENERVKITYIPSNSGVYEINLISNGEHIQGSPYCVRVINNTSGLHDSFGEELEEQDEKMCVTKRKVLSKVIDCIDEKIYIANGADEDLILKKRDEILKTHTDSCSLENILEETSGEVIDIDRIDGLKPSGILIHEDENVKQNSSDFNFDPSDEDAEKSKNLVDLNFQNSLHQSTEDNFAQEIKEFRTTKESSEEDDNNLKSWFEIKKENEIFELQTNSSSIKYILENSAGKVNDITNGLKSAVLVKENSKRVTQYEDDAAKSKMLNKCSSKLGLTHQNSSKKEIVEDKVSQRIKKISTTKEDEAVTRTQQPIESRFVISNKTSSICPDHIASEVTQANFNYLPVTERRKLFSKPSVSNPNLNLYEKIEDHVSNSNLQQLNAFNIKQSQDSGFFDEPSLHRSLPNMSLSESEINFKATRDYWERRSSRGSSNFGSNESDFGSAKKLNVFNKFNNNICVNSVAKSENKKIIKVGNLGEDLTDLKEKNSTKSLLSKWKDDSLDSCNRLSIQERKRILFEKQGIEVHNNNNDNKNKAKTNYKNGTVGFKTEKTTMDTTFPVQKTINSSVIIPKPVKQDKDNKVKSPFRGQFKKAISFFKNLENKSNAPTTIRNNNDNNVKRRFSLDFPQRNKLKNENNKKGGSLNFPNISERFSINNLYEDVFGDRKGSFRGLPNRMAVINSLASFTGKESANVKQNEEDNIKFSLFLNRARIKKRRSVKSLFDVDY